ncbi:MAG: hypothetical protein ACP5FL_07460, partial [Thermoplasmatota archaeon]
KKIKAVATTFLLLAMLGSSLSAVKAAASDGSEQQFIPTSEDLYSESRYALERDSQGQIYFKEHHISLEAAFHDLSIEQRTIAGHTYASVSIDGLQTFANPGSPLLPVKPLYVLLPPQSHVDTIQTTPNGGINHIKVDHQVIPGLPVYPISTGGPPLENGVPENPDIYGRNSYFPAQVFEKVGV